MFVWYRFSDEVVSLMVVLFLKLLYKYVNSEMIVFFVVYFWLNDFVYVLNGYCISVDNRML